MTGRQHLTVIILTLNEETNLPACLESIRGLDCAVWVVDSGSTDHTLEIAERFVAITCEHAFENYAAQRNWALNNVPVETDWVLNLDADERLTSELVEEINSKLKEAPTEVDGYLLRKRTIFMGRWMRHGGHYPTYHLRLFRRNYGRCEDRLYDQHFVVDGRVGRLTHDYLDVVSSSLLTWTARHTRWAAMEAKQLATSEDAGNLVVPDVIGNPIERRRWWRNLYSRWPLFMRPVCYWFYRYFVRLGFMDGREGLIFHFLQCLWFRFLIDSMIHETNRSVGRRNGVTACDVAIDGVLRR